MRIECQKKSEAATTLVEVLVASCIIALMSGAIINSCNYGMFVMRLARENQRATQILLERTEAIRLYNWDQINQPGFVPSTFMAAYDPQDPKAPGITYHGTMIITNYSSASTYATNMRQCLITLNWTTANRINHERSTSTLIAKDGVQNYVY